MQSGMVYNIQRMSTMDGPGLRTTVFLKGCPLRCQWCSNPESQLAVPQLMVFENLCTGCGACEKTCPAGAVTKTGATYNRDTSLCRNCGACVEGCPAKARVMSGKLMSVAEVMDVIRKDSLFYQNSGGGVTFGGGEPTMAGAFLLALLQTCRDEGMHTCVDTCGYCQEDFFAKVVDLTDLFLFDCKHMFPERHKQLTSRDNARIQANLRTALQSRAQVRIRMPLIPDQNDSRENIAAMAEFLRAYGADEVDVMPYHTFGRNKYVALNWPAPALRSYTPEELPGVLQRFSDLGLKTRIV